MTQNIFALNIYISWDGDIDPRTDWRIINVDIILNPLDVSM